MEWVRASACLGAASSVAALGLSWRDLPGCPAPAGSLGGHALRVGMLGIHKAFGWAFAQRAAAYSDYLSALDGAQRAAIEGRVAFAILVGLIPAAFMFGRFMVPRDGLVHLRGPLRHSGKEAAKRLKSALAKRVARRPDIEIAPGIAYPSDLWRRHLVMVAAPAGGKTTAIYPWAGQAVAAGDFALISDTKGEFTAAFPTAAILAPWDARSESWAIAKDLRNKGDMRRFAARMIPKGQDPMWSSAARQVLVGLLMMLKRTRGAEWGWRDLADLMSIELAELLPIMREHNPEAVRAVERASVTTAGIMINLAAFCSPIFDLAEAWEGMPPERGISFVDWTMGRGPHRQVILQGNGAYEELTRGYLSAVLEIVAGLVASPEMDDDPGWKSWIICDEAAQMGPAPFATLCATSRSRNMRCVIATQDPAQLEEIHGAGAVRSLMSMCGTVVVGGMSPGETAESLAKAFGSREVERANVSTSRGANGERSTSRSWARETVALYTADELSSRLGLSEDGKSVRLAVLTGGQSYELDFPIRERAKLRPAHVPAAWTLGVDVGPQASAMAASGGDGGIEAVPRPASGEAPPARGASEGAAALDAGGDMRRWLESSGALFGNEGKPPAAVAGAAEPGVEGSGDWGGYGAPANVSPIGRARPNSLKERLGEPFRLDRFPVPGEGSPPHGKPASAPSVGARISRCGIGPPSAVNASTETMKGEEGMRDGETGIGSLAGEAPDVGLSNVVELFAGLAAERKKAARPERSDSEESATPSAGSSADDARDGEGRSEAFAARRMRRRAMATFAALVFRSVAELLSKSICG